MLQVAGVLKAFQGVVALDHVTLSVRPGEVRALIGGNGAGKSTLVKVLSGVHQPDAGELRYLGEPVRFAGPAEARSAGIEGARQLVALARAASAVRTLFGAVARLREEGRSVVYVTHRLEELYEMCDRVTEVTEDRLLAALAKG